MARKIRSLSEAWKILEKKGFEIGFTEDYIPYRIENHKTGFKKYMNRKEVLFFVNYEIKNEITK
ncbi:MAG TPA: hypothetical protein VMZ91_16365 [Candidatus Paceibacterota bacterium]|nr:hypothetical protein [Candidatus Paceibacterota bacterium]